MRGRSSLQSVESGGLPGLHAELPEMHHATEALGEDVLHEVHLAAHRHAARRDQHVALKRIDAVRKTLAQRLDANTLQKKKITRLY